MLENAVQLLTTWITTHTALSTWAVFTIVFLETFAVIGVFIPGAAIMPAIGALIGAKIIPLYATVFATFIAGCLGDNLSYFIGQHFHQRIYRLWPFCRYPQLFKNAQAFLQKHGRKSIFLGRFFGPLRAMLPLLAGMMDMPWRRFFIADTFSAITWTIFYLLPGFVLGALSQILPHTFSLQNIVLGILAILLLWIAAIVALYYYRQWKKRQLMENNHVLRNQPYQK